MKKIFWVLYIILMFIVPAYGWIMTPVVGGVATGGSVTVSYIAYASVSGFSASQSCAMPTGTTDGDLMIAFAASDTGGTAPSPPAGWTEIDKEANGDPVNMYSGSWYRIASSDSGPFVWTMAADDGGVFILTFRKSGGSWTAPTTAGYHSINSEISATSTAASVTANTGDAIAVLYSNDGYNSVDTPPSGMTGTTLETPSTAFSLTAYYETGLSSGSKTPALVWNSSDEVQAVAVIVHAQ